jgi:hypothetical protein
MSTKTVELIEWKIKPDSVQTSRARGFSSVSYFLGDAASRFDARP